ncbi:hypothetical protein HK100_003378 [Physocladia obscura]|uniref:L domain-like protein n=1 Tax=Physocladia obscura TaxID=109957 RepID=A0AAD5XJT0_9FUNG|nr:hypothetical protein HK100_003378 [Physocladia obscura]
MAKGVTTTASATRHQQQNTLAATLTTLPDELLLETLSWLHPTIALRAANASKTLRQCVFSAHFARANLRRFMRTRPCSFDNSTGVIRRVHEYDALFFRWPKVYQTVYAQLYLAPLRGLNWGDSDAPGARNCNDETTSDKAIDRDHYEDTENDNDNDNDDDLDAVQMRREYGGGFVGHLDAPIPAAIGLLSPTNLVLINLNQCGLVGQIPVELTSLHALRVLSMAINKLTGNIPDEIGNLSNLVSINLFYNELDGAIPSSFGNLVNLTECFMGWNKLSSVIPRSIGSMRALKTLSLAENLLEGDLPEGLYDLDNLEAVFLNDNFLTGSISPAIVKMERLTQLYLSNNQLSGAVPQEMLALDYFTGGDLSGNSLTIDFEIQGLKLYTPAVQPTLSSL